MFDVFYIGKKTNLFLHEKSAESIQHACKQSRTRYCWIVNYLADYTDWDWLWEPVPWQSHQRHAWASQWQKDSGTYLVPKLGYAETNYHSEKIKMQADLSNWQNVDSVEQFDFSWHPDYTDPPYNYEFGTQWQKTGGPCYPLTGATETKYVSQSGSTVRAQALTVYVIDHMCGDTVDTVTTISTQASVHRIVRYFDNYLDTLTRIANNANDEQLEYIWICSSICNYIDFDFTWHPETWQNHMLHVFPSNNQKFGDTFFMHVPTFVSKIKQFELLEWYDLNFVSTISVPRHPMPIVKHTEDSHVNLVRNHKWTAPLTMFTTVDYTDSCPHTVSLWRDRSKTIVPLSADASSVIVPQVAVSYIKTQLYDYPHIDKTHRNTSNAVLQDVVFISYDEPEADQNWKILKDCCSRATRVHGVAGMELALETAANVSTTPWFFAVFAKTQLHREFDFSFGPDRMQLPKHYIFNCLNISNRLEYGHMGVVLYNCQGVRDTNRAGNFGLDYTLSFPHESVPLLSCYGDFATTPYHAWRTSFRETAKLSYFEQTQPSVDNHHRLGVWLTHAEGNHADWVLKGAQDGSEFYKITNNDLTKLKQSFKWDWLHKYFVTKYGNELK